MGVSVLSDHSLLLSDVLHIDAAHVLWPLVRLFVCPDIHVSVMIKASEYGSN